MTTTVMEGKTLPFEIQDVPLEELPAEIDPFAQAAIDPIEAATGTVPVPIAADTSLCFDVTPGPLVAICGLCGGAGTSTITYVLAAAAAARSRLPILACETSGITGGLSLYARIEGRTTLGEAANQIAIGGRVAALVETLITPSPDGVLILASRPAFRVDGEPAGVKQILTEARQASGLTVMDCGTGAHEIDRQVLALASHILWVMPATESGLARATNALDALRLPGQPVQAIIARLDRDESTLLIRPLLELGERERASIILFPHVKDIAEAPVSEAIADAQVTLQGIDSLLRG